MHDNFLNKFKVKEGTDFELEECPDVLEWAEAIERMNRQVALDEIGQWRISTVFLGIWHCGGIFETMVFNTQDTFEVKDGLPVLMNGPVEIRDGVILNYRDYQRRYDTVQEARTGHAKVREAIRKGKSLSQL